MILDQRLAAARDEDEVSRCRPPRASSTAYWTIGLSTTGSISLGSALVAGSMRVPSPATGKTTLRIRPIISILTVPPALGTARRGRRTLGERARGRAIDEGSFTGWGLCRATTRHLPDPWAPRDHTEGCRERPGRRRHPQPGAPGRDARDARHCRNLESAPSWQRRFVAWAAQRPAAFRHRRPAPCREGEGPCGSAGEHRPTLAMRSGG